MSHANGHRWSKFWWQDWASDPALRACSLAARGLWMALLCVMHEAAPRGYLLIDGLPPTAKQLASITGATLRELATLLAELKAARVYSTDADGWIYSRRMVRDTAASEKGYETGKRGGNPALRPKPNGEDRNPTKGVNPTPLTPPVNALRYGPPLTPTVNPESEADSELERKKGDPPLPSRRAGGDNPLIDQFDGNRLRADGPRASGTNPRALGTNPRALSQNPRISGQNPRARRFRNGAVELVMVQGFETFDPFADEPAPRLSDAS